MNKNQIQGTVKDLTGKVKKEAGKPFENRRKKPRARQAEDLYGYFEK